jgi:hypothetical protein
MYPRALEEFYRVLRLDGRCALLTAERKMILRLLGLSNGRWLLKREVRVRMSGLPCSLFLIQKQDPKSIVSTSAPPVVPSEKEEEDEEHFEGK